MLPAVPFPKPVPSLSSEIPHKQRFMGFATNCLQAKLLRYGDSARLHDTALRLTIANRKTEDSDLTDVFVRRTTENFQYVESH